MNGKWTKREIGEREVNEMDMLLNLNWTAFNFWNRELELNGVHKFKNERELNAVQNFRELVSHFFLP